MSLKLYFDGCSKGNSSTSPAGCGWVIYYNDNKIKSNNKNIGKGTNNEAEYQGIINGLNDILSLNLSFNKLDIYGDSLLVINHLKGKYKVKAPNLIPLYTNVKNILKENFKDIEIEFTHVYREFNELADVMANRSLTG